MQSPAYACPHYFDPADWVLFQSSYPISKGLLVLLSSGETEAPRKGRLNWDHGKDEQGIGLLDEI